MSHWEKIFYSLVIASAIFLFLAKTVLAQVVINEFSSNNGTDWVEVYNTSEESIDLSGSYYQLRDTSPSGNPKNLDCLLPDSGHFSVDWGNNLNNDGDRIVLLKGEQMIDCVAYGDGNGSVCEGKEQVDLEKLNPGEYGVRDPEGSGGWIKTTSRTSAGSSECLTPAPTPTPTPTPRPTNIPTPTPTPKPPSPTPKPPTPTPRPTPKPTPTKMPTATPSVSASDEDEESLVLSASSVSELTMMPSPTPPESTPQILGENTSKPNNFFPFVFIGLGAVLVVASGAFLLIPKMRRYNDKKYESGETH
ncbi:MAG: lamin tail domain-containing protein [bacterium]|nr:lamin tail domain-containing protein [bacterium]